MKAAGGQDEDGGDQNHVCSEVDPADTQLFAAVRSCRLRFSASSDMSAHIQQLQTAVVASAPPRARKQLGSWL